MNLSGVQEDLWKVSIPSLNVYKKNFSKDKEKKGDLIFLLEKARKYWSKCTVYWFGNNVIKAVLMKFLEFFFLLLIIIDAQQQ